MIGIGIANSCGLGKVVTTTTVAFDANAQAFITAAAITDATQQSAINNLVIGLKADGLWTNMYAIYPFVGGTASQHKYNLKDPRDLNAAFRLQFNGGMTHSSNGILFNGTNGWADTSVAVKPYGFGVYNRNATDNGQYYIGSQGDREFCDEEGCVSYIRSRFLLSGFDAWLGDLYSPLTTSSIPNKRGLHVMNSGKSFYKNGVFITSNAQYGPDWEMNLPMAIGACNPNPSLSSLTLESYSNQQIAFAFMANASFNATQNTNLYTRIQSFQTALSRQV